MRNMSQDQTRESCINTKCGFHKNVLEVTSKITITPKWFLHMETNQLSYIESQLTGFYIRGASFIIELKTVMDSAEEVRPLMWWYSDTQFFSCAEKACKFNTGLVVKNLKLKFLFTSLPREDTIKNFCLSHIHTFNTYW